MKNILSKLRAMNEELNNINIDIIKEVCLNSSEFYYNGQDIEDRLNEDDNIEVVETKVNTGDELFSIDHDSLYICDENTFNNMVVNCANEYKDKFINEWLAPFFDSSKYIEDCKKDKALISMLLEHINNISKWEKVDFNNTKYVIMK